MKNHAQLFRISTFLLCNATVIAMLIPKSILWCSYGYDLEMVYTYRNYFTFTIFGCPAVFFLLPFFILCFIAIVKRRNYTVLHWLLCGILLFAMYVFGVFLFGAQHCRDVYFVWQPFLPPLLLIGSMLTSLAASLCDLFSGKTE